MNNTEQVAFGQYGSVVATDSQADATGGKVFVAITALTDATLDANTTAEQDSAGNSFECPTDISIPAGLTIYGRWTSVEVGSDEKVLCYLGK